MVGGNDDARAMLKNLKPPTGEKVKTIKKPGTK
jgi:hypothetical protein